VNLLETNLLGLPADLPLLRSIRDALSTGPRGTEILALVLGLATLALLIVIAARFFTSERQKSTGTQVDYLTMAVDLLGLSEEDRRLLQQVAQHTGLEQPVAMLLSPQNLAHAAASALSPEDGGRLRKRLEQLSMQLFGTPLPSP
jgi:hypothetical protein